MAHALLDRPDEFITMMFGEKECGISNIKRVSTHANMDDTVTHLTLQANEEMKGILSDDNCNWKTLFPI